MQQVMDSQDYLKLSKVLKIVILILLLVLLILIRVYRLDSCDKCNFNIEGQRLSQADFMKYYSSKCLVKEKPIYNYSSINLSGILVKP